MARKLLLAALLLSGIGAAVWYVFPSSKGHMSADDPNHLPATAPTVTSSYGPDPLQVGDLRLPDLDGPFPVAVVIHGGCWTNGFATRQHTAAMASALTKRGIATWNIEYRQLGNSGGGWPGSFQDWGNATDHLRVLAQDYPLDLSRVLVAGHSAGAHAALFVASRKGLPADSEIRGADPLPVQAAVAIDGPGDLARFSAIDQDICGAPVIDQFFGGTEQEVPGRYAEGSPVNQLPIKAAIAMVSASDVLDRPSAEAFLAASAAAGSTVELRVLTGSGHFEPIAPGESEWDAVENLILQMFADMESPG